MTVKSNHPQFIWLCEQYIDGLVQDCSISSANALEILQSCTKTSIYSKKYNQYFIIFVVSTVHGLNHFDGNMNVCI